MSEEQLKAFVAKVQSDTALQEQLKAEGADVVALAKAAGCSITSEEVNTYMYNMQNRQRNLSDEEIEAVTGSGGCTGFWCAGITA